ncbi:hypothetical protein C9374_000845 [Naegleria lovaniensis]|uniref:Chromate transporter n=1 Tax=Naegleria lovaniensis TaxID=51637 RepID=A0AA88GSC7_NAELO|nr:uncharacterized protein C9374_000845 [Naegleria lovaniensis]KAG2387995.1 hypothetical protein C9374_000845 [Naegleria lovaniensis]
MDSHHPPNKKQQLLSYLWKIWEITYTMIPLGILSFGGPMAHIALLQDNFVTKRQWLTAEKFTELFAVCQSLPGPTSTQLVLTIGTMHAGYLGGLLAFLLFSIPTAIIMAVAGILLKDEKVTEKFPYYLTVALNGFSCAAVAIVAHAAYTLSSRLTKDISSKTLLIGAFATFMIWQKWWVVLIVMICGGTINLSIDYSFIYYQTAVKEHGLTKPKGIFDSVKFYWTVFKINLKKFKTFMRDLFNKIRRNRQNIPTRINSGNLDDTEAPQLLEENAVEDLESNSPIDDEKPKNNDNELITTTNVTSLPPSINQDVPLHMRPFMSFIFIGLFIIILLGLMIARLIVKWPPLEWAEGFYRIGCLIFGGGHVVLPMILNEFSELGYLTEDAFVNGFALQSALPGPMFNFSAYVGGIMGGVLGAIICWVALFLPAVLVVLGALPVWNRYREKQFVQSLLKGVNATSVGFVFTAVYILWLASVPNLHVASACTVVFSILFLSVWDLPAPLVILMGGAVRIALDGFVPRNA